MTARRARDVERGATAKQFAAKLRRLADAVEAGTAFTIQVGGERLRIPANAELSIEHERAKGISELELQVRWSDVAQ
jgi:amphi-Trp domain-containing protein